MLVNLDGFFEFMAKPLYRVGFSTPKYIYICLFVSFLLNCQWFLRLADHFWPQIRAFPLNFSVHFHHSLRVNYIRKIISVLLKPSFWEPFVCQHSQIIFFPYFFFFFTDRLLSNNHAPQYELLNRNTQFALLLHRVVIYTICTAKQHIFIHNIHIHYTQFCYDWRN